MNPEANRKTIGYRLTKEMVENIEREVNEMGPDITKEEKEAIGKKHMAIRTHKIKEHHEILTEVCKMQPKSDHLWHQDFKHYFGDTVEKKLDQSVEIGNELAEQAVRDINREIHGIGPRITPQEKIEIIERHQKIKRENLLRRVINLWKKK